MTASTMRTREHWQVDCPDCKGNGFIAGQACPRCTHPLSPAGLASIGWGCPAAEHEPADRDALALSRMTHAQFRLSMLRLFPLAQPLDQQTLDYIAAIYRELPA